MSTFTLNGEWPSFASLAFDEHWLHKRVRQENFCTSQQKWNVHLVGGFNLSEKYSSIGMIILNV